MFTDHFITLIREADIRDIIEHYEALKGDKQIPCPFHAEKTGSFHIYKKSNRYKCFGCGVSGDGIQFVMEKERMTFAEAVLKIADILKIVPEFQANYNPEAEAEKKTKQQQIESAFQLAQSRYTKALFNLDEADPVKQYLHNRGINDEVAADWQLGWAGTGWDGLTLTLTNQGDFYGAKEAGLIRQSKDGEKHYDAYRNRITIPIFSRHGQLIGLGGRLFGEAETQAPKYINPTENSLYQKSQTLFGLDRAGKAIADARFVYLCEGYFDVISMHLAGHENTVATCGTALTEAQVKILARYTRHIRILRDGDKAGMIAATKDISLLIKAGMQISISIMPDGEDPDSFIRQLTADGKTMADHPHQDAIIWRANTLLDDASDDPHTKANAQLAALELLASIPNDIIRKNYYNTIADRHKWRKKDTEPKLAQLAEDLHDPENQPADEYANMPDWMDKEMVLDQGFCPVKRKGKYGYFAWGSNGQSQVTNFLITPLFHVYEGKDSTFMIHVDNGRRQAVLDIEAKALVSIDLLQQYVVAEGNFIIHGSKPQMLRVASTLLEAFPKCIKVKFLGWQPGGFFAYPEKVFVPGQGLKEVDQWGIFQYKSDKIDNGKTNNFLLPPASAAYRELQNTGEDPYEQERVLTFRPGTITWADYIHKFHRVWREKAPVAIAFIILTTFRDMVFEVDNNCPHLYGFGERSSGKSKWADSISAFFFNKRAAFNLNSGTDFAFFAYMQRFRNCPAQLNEFDITTMKPDWFQAIKAVFDGEGRQRGSMQKRDQVEIMKVNSTLILTGQYLVTTDDNSIVSRSIIESFHEQEYSDEDKKEFDLLKDIQEAGLHHLHTELMQLRPYFKEKYKQLFTDTLSEWRHRITGDTVFNIRIMQNWCHLYTGYALVADTHAMPVTPAQFDEYCFSRAMQWSRFIRNSDTISEFWHTLLFLAEQQTIEEGWDYTIKEVFSVKLRDGDKKEYTHNFNEPTKLLFLRLNNVHKLYQSAYRSRTGKEGMSIENLKHYFSSRKYYVGSAPKVRFCRFVYKTENRTYQSGINNTPITSPVTAKEPQPKVTSAYVFLYDQLDIDLEVTNESIFPDEPEISEPEAEQAEMDFESDMYQKRI